MDKNVLIAEILYTIFVHYKGLGKKYKTGRLKNEMHDSLIAVKLLYKNELSQSDVRHIRKILGICNRYTAADISEISLENITGKAVEVTEPADKMCEIIGRIITECSCIFTRDRIAVYFFALHNLPRAYMSDNATCLGEKTGLQLRPDEALKYCNEWLEKTEDKHG